MEGLGASSISSGVQGNATSHNSGRVILDGYKINHVPVSGFPGLKKRGHAHGSRSWIKIDEGGNSKVLELDKATVMRHCSLPARDLRLLDPLFIYPSTILGREKAIVVSLEQIRCIITADEVILMNSLDANVVQYKAELCKRLQTNKEQSDDLPFEFRALELALELTCMSLDAQVKELEMEMHPVLDELASSISTLNLERVRRFKGQLLALTQRVQKVCDEIEHLMDDDGDMAEMYLTEKKQRQEAYLISELYSETNVSGGPRLVSKSAPVSPVGSTSRVQKLQRAFSCLSSSKHGSLTGSSNGGENIDQLEMLLEAYFVGIDNTLNKLLSLKEYIDDTEDLIHIKLGNVQNQLIQFELLLTAATFVTTIFAVVTGIFGMNFEAMVFDYPDAFNWVIIISGVFCAMLYISFLIYFRHKKVFPL
ncbi:magnesium transporter MRS2-5-like [Actinidia eriantha]|uniref:magnesium transporter MRS2-5-like n=1 Tax=Actinidia eriantha TaxID=165200 RepID=UPI00258CBE69|nr:magnesium transporter MRS2-5-like [Actinidia eriantha]XP_057493304.1 magnesium transporter MRS2-5-like [Actinidia eriantha]XP_057493305.1 magnesium transporter MRS2-5-like [Actinidia eriantha]